MVRTKKSLLFALVMSLVVVMGVSLAACSNGNDSTTTAAEYTVKFMVKENGVGEWKDYAQPVKSVNGKVTLPAEPSIEGFSFRGWFEDEICETAFDENNVTKDITVYAHMSDKVLTVKVNKGDVIDTKPEQNVADLTSLENSYNLDAEANNLTFDGWYSNEACTVKYNAESGSTEVFGRYVALVTFDNGYEKVGKEIKVVPGGKIEAPTVEDVKKDYMAEDDIYFVKDNGDDYAFDKDVFEKNTEIKVLWKTPGLKYKKVTGSSTLYQVSGIDYSIDYASLPVVSIPSRITVVERVIDPETQQSVNKNVEKQAVKYDGSTIAWFKNAKKVIVNEGIKYIRGFESQYSGAEQLLIEEVELPSTLKVIEKSFNNFAPDMKLKEIVIPDGVEFIIDSFWGDYNNHLTNSKRNAGYPDLEIVIPASVTNVVSVPVGLKYAEGSKYVNDVENNRVYKVYDNKKVLVSDIEANLVNGVLSIPEGVTALQVGSLDYIPFDILQIPSSVVEINYSYNDNSANYDFYDGFFITDKTQIDSLTSTDRWELNAYSVVSNLSDRQYIAFNTTKYPEGMSKFAFNDNRIPYDELTGDKVVFTGEVADGTQYEVKISYFNDEMDKYKGVTTLNLNKNANLSKNDIINAVASGLGKTPGDLADIVITSFGEEFVEGSKKCNQYINFNYKFNFTGVKLEQIDQTGTYRVIGLDTASALSMDNKYMIRIPETYNGGKVVEIAASAFDKAEQDYQKIAEVYFGKNVKVIGDNAFANLSNLEKVIIPDGSELTTIGAHAFEYAGAIEQDGNYIVNPDLTAILNYFSGKELPSLYIELPLAKITNIGPCAFNTPAIRTFVMVESEIETGGFSNGYGWAARDKSEPIEGRFYYLSGNNKPVGIVKYVGKENVVFTNGEDSAPYIKQKLELYSTAGGYIEATGGLGLGCSKGANGVVCSMVVKEGSVHFYEYLERGISFALIDKVETGAFVYLNEKLMELDSYGRTRLVFMRDDNPYPTNTTWAPFAKFWMKENEVKTMSQINFGETKDGITNTIFENGWYMGQDNNKNTFMNNCSKSSSVSPGMA